MRRHCGAERCKEARKGGLSRGQSAGIARGGFGGGFGRGGDTRALRACGGGACNWLVVVDVIGGRGGRGFPVAAVLQDGRPHEQSAMTYMGDGDGERKGTKGTGNSGRILRSGR